MEKGILGKEGEMAFRRSGRALDRLLTRYPRLRVAARKVLVTELERPQTVPLALTGKWVAWTEDGRRIVASGKSAKEARDAAVKVGVRNPVCEWIPKAEELRSVNREATPQP